MNDLGLIEKDIQYIESLPIRLEHRRRQLVIGIILTVSGLILLAISILIVFYYYKQLDKTFFFIEDEINKLAGILMIVNYIGVLGYTWFFSK